MIVEIISTGDEVLEGIVVDSNAAYIADVLTAAGLPVGRHTCVGDDKEALSEVMTESAGRADVVIVTGGLGPTHDDLTAAAAAKVAGVQLVQNREALAGVERFFSYLGVEPGYTDKKQTMLPEGSHCLDNPVGSAPGFRMTLEWSTFFFLPGVPVEARRMLRDHVLPWLTLTGLTGGDHILIKTVSCFGLAEALIGERLETVRKVFPGIRIGTRVHFPAIDIRLADKGPSLEKIASRLEDAAKKVVAAIGEQYIYSIAGKTMEAEVGALLNSSKCSLSLAESCTGGLISNMITDVAGSSDYFLFSGVTYSNRSKIDMLGVSPETIEKYGTVHEETAKQMADGVRRLSGADFGLSTSGIAGPGGGSPEKPVGTICIGLSSRFGTNGYRFRFPFGDRWKNKTVFAVTALDLLRKEILRLRSQV